MATNMEMLSGETGPSPGLVYTELETERGVWAARTLEIRSADNEKLDNYNTVLT